MASGNEVARRRVRERIAALGSRGVTSRVPDDVRAEIVHYVVERRRAGASWRVIVDDVGFSASALADWLRRGRTAVVPVRVRPDTPSPATTASVIVVLANGVRVEGLRVADVSAVLAQLA